MNDERLYFVVYDISFPRRYRKVFKTLKGYGEWVQLSVFQCRLTRIQYLELIAELDELIDHDEDHIVAIDVGLADKVDPKVTAIGVRDFEPISKGSIIL